MSLCEKIVRGVVGADLFNAGIDHIHLGSLKAALSPQNNRVLKLLDPSRSDGTVSHDENCVPTVKFEYLTFDVDSDVKTSPSCSAEELEYGLGSAEVKIDKYIEKGFQISNCTINGLCAEVDNLHREQVVNGRSISSPAKGIYRNVINANLVLRTRIMLEAANRVSAEGIVANIGNNPVYGTDIAQDIQLFANTEERGHLIHFRDEIRKLWRIMGYTSVPIILTANQDLLTWFDRICNVPCCSSAGIDYSKVQEGGFEVYYDPLMADELGQDEFLVLTAEAFMFLTVDRWRNLKMAIAGDKIANTTIGAFAIQEPSARYLAGTCLAEQPNPLTRFDLRIKEQDCAADSFLPSLTFLPSLQYNTWGRPADANGVSGIFRYRVVSQITPAPPVTYTVTFNSNGGSAVSPISGLGSGDEIDAPTAPTRSGFTFGGWYKEVGLTTLWDFDTDVVTSNTTLYAKWTAE